MAKTYYEKEEDAVRQIVAEESRKTYLRAKYKKKRSRWTLAGKGSGLAWWALQVQVSSKKKAVWRARSKQFSRLFVENNKLRAQIEDAQAEVQRLAKGWQNSEKEFKQQNEILKLERIKLSVFRQSLSDEVATVSMLQRELAETKEQLARVEDDLANSADEARMQGERDDLYPENN